MNLQQVDDEYENYAQTVSDIEIVNIMELELNDPSHKIFDMNSTYQKLLLPNGMPEDEIKLNYKRYLKDRLLKNVPNVKFVKNKNPSKPEEVCSEITQGQAIDIALSKNKHEILADILNISKVIREELRTKLRTKNGNSLAHFPHLKNQIFCQR